MFLCAVLLTALLSPFPGELRGQATYYNSGLMQQAGANRLRWRQIAPCVECVDGVALLDCRHLGKKVWLQHPQGKMVGPLQVIDCAAGKHAAALARRGWVVDVSWELGHEHWKMRGPMEGLRVLWVDPAPVTPGQQMEEARMNAELQAALKRVEVGVSRIGDANLILHRIIDLEAQLEDARARERVSCRRATLLEAWVLQHVDGTGPGEARLGEVDGQMCVVFAPNGWERCAARPVEATDAGEIREPGVGTDPGR